MRKTGVLAAAFAACACAGSISLASAAAPAKHKTLDVPDVRSASVLVLDDSDSSVIYARNEKAVTPIASITKLMTALVVLDGKQPLDERIEIRKGDVWKGKGWFSRLPVGAKLTRGDLLHLALMSSENRAAHVLGRNYPGGLATFVRTMNLKAKALGMTNTRFVDASGLSAQNVSTARDLARLIAAAARNPDIRAYSTSPRHSVRVGRQTLTFGNTNSLVSNPLWHVAVQKTGFLNEAGHCLVMQATVDERPVTFILLNSFGKYTRVADAKRIREWMEGRSAARASKVAAAD
jgi:D-alanyl-D-alanine endopeptidase (penicillin-binding protein 7)